MGGNVGRKLEVANLAVTERRKHLTMRCSQPLAAPMRSFRVVRMSRLQSHARSGVVADLGSR